MIDTAVIVEPRMHPYLKRVIDNMIELLNINTKIMVFHSDINELFLYNEYKNNKRIIMYKLTNLINNNLTIPEYNILLTSKDFWNKIDGEYILIFQTDSCLCQRVDNIDIYKEYGFVGAPSKPINHKLNSWLNGGLSLRRKSLTLKCLDTIPQNKQITISEDYFYTVQCKDIIKPTPYNIALTFSIEKYHYKNPLGIHKTWNYMNKEQWEEFKNKYTAVNNCFSDINRD